MKTDENNHFVFEEKDRLDWEPLGLNEKVVDQVTTRWLSTYTSSNEKKELDKCFYYYDSRDFISSVWKIVKKEKSWIGKAKKHYKFGFVHMASV